MGKIPHLSLVALLLMGKNPIPSSYPSFNSSLNVRTRYEKQSEINWHLSYFCFSKNNREISLQIYSFIFALYILPIGFFYRSMIEGKRTKNNLIGRKANMMLCLGSNVSRFDKVFVLCYRKSWVIWGMLIHLWYLRWLWNK